MEPIRDDAPIKHPVGSGRTVVAVIVVGGLLLASIGLRYRVKDPSKLPGATQPSLFDYEASKGSRAQ